MADPTCSNSPLSLLHKFAYEGSKNKLKNLLKTEQNVDKLDQNGNTALYCACARGEKDCAKILLEKGANPNERCQHNETPMHVAARYGQVKILLLLLEYGGDLRLHDSFNRTPKTCAMQQENAALRRKTLALIEETRMNAQLQTNKTDAQKLSLLSITPKSRDELVNPCSVGFGILYKSTGEIGVPIVLPIIKENELEHDYLGETFNNGAFMVYESMKWKELHLVTVKRLHSNIADQGHSDLLIEELKYFKKINHCPNILSIMGFCQYVNSEGLMLMFERVQVGSLFAVLHERQLTKPPKLKSICQIMLNVCDALIYLHQMNILHCYVSSHSVFLTTFHTAKLGNFEYAVEKSGDLSKQKKTKIVENKMENCAYNWLAPEILENSIPTELSDMYSYCAVIWELFECRIPWQSCDHIEIQHEMLIKGNSLPVDHEKIAFPFNRIVKDGFSNPIKRMSFEEVRAVLENYQINLHQNQSMSKIKVSRLYQRVPNRVKSNSVSGIETLNSDEVDRNSHNSAEYIKCDAYRAEILLKNTTNKKSVLDRAKKSGQSSPGQQLPPTPPSAQLSAKLSSTPQNKNFGILSPSPSPRVRPSSIDSPRSIKSESLTPKFVHSNLSTVGIRKIEKDIQENKRRIVLDDLRNRQINLVNNKFGDFRENLTEPTPEAKRDGYNKNFSSPRLDSGDFARAQRLDYSNVSQDENNEKKTHGTNKELISNESRASTEELRMKQEQRSQQSSSVESSSTYIRSNLAHRSGSQSRMSENTKRTGDRTSRTNTAKHKRSHTDNKPAQCGRSLSHSGARNQVETKPHSNESNTEEFFGGHGSVRSLVQSYEEQSAKNEADPRIEKIRLERLNEIKSLKKQFDQEQANCQLQKELSTISERTEQTNNSVNLANTIDSPTGLVQINTNSKSANTVTNAVRQINDKFLDSSTGASGDICSVTNRNLSALNSSTPIQTNNLSQTSNKLTNKSTIEAIQNLKLERNEIQIPIYYNGKSNNSDSDNDDQLIKTGARLETKKTPEPTNRTKSNQSSQEDYLSNTQACEVTSMEYSENLYLTDFDRLNSNTPQTSLPRPTLTYDGRKFKFDGEIRADENEPSTSSIAAADSVSSLEENNGAPITENTVYKNTKQGNVRLDKHVIDTSKFSGYQYQLETKSNPSNKYHIKGLLLNQQTGHSLVVQNTKIKAPSMSTKVVIDKL